MLHNSTVPLLPGSFLSADTRSNQPFLQYPVFGTNHGSSHPESLNRSGESPTLRVGRRLGPLGLRAEQERSKLTSPPAVAS
jgi:hypothetical protein